MLAALCILATWDCSRTFNSTLIAFTSNLGFCGIRLKILPDHIWRLESLCERPKELVVADFVLKVGFDISWVYQNDLAQIDVDPMDLDRIELDHYLILNKISLLMISF